MSDHTHIKLGGITNLSDARYAASVGVHYIGFCFDTASSHYIPPIKAKEMMDWISGGHLVAEFGRQSLSEIKDLCELLPVNAIEVENALLPDELKELDKAIIKKINLDLFPWDNLMKEIAAYSQVADAFHLYSSHTGLPYPKDQLKTLCNDYKIIWGVPLTADYIRDVVEAIHPYAINLLGGDEEKPGIRDFEELGEIIDLLIPLD